MIIRSEEKNRGKWPLGIVEELFEGRDGVVQAVKLRAGKKVPGESDPAPVPSGVQV